MFSFEIFGAWVFWDFGFMYFALPPKNFQKSWIAKLASIRKNPHAAKNYNDKPTMARVGTSLRPKIILGGALNMLNSFGTLKKCLYTRRKIRSFSIFRQNSLSYFERIVETWPEFQQLIFNVEASKIYSFSRSWWILISSKIACTVIWHNCRIIERYWGYQKYFWFSKKNHENSVCKR